MTILPFPSQLGAAAQAAARTPADEAAAAFQKRCFDAYRNRCTSRGLTAKYVEKCLGSVLDLLQWSGKTLTSVAEADYEAWAARGERWMTS